MKILVAIANHGTSNESFVRTLIESYRGFDHDVSIVVLSNVSKDLGPNVEVRVGMPTVNPWSLPFAHKALFAERQDEYDLFIYSEDDTLIESCAIDAFLQAEALLPPDHIAGFLRHEIAGDGSIHYSTAHGSYHWDPGSVFMSGGEVFARYTNDHSAAFILSREKLKHCITSGQFLCAPHEGRYDLLCSAATDPYTRCGLRKVICVSRFSEFSLHHLPNKYIGKIGVPKTEMDLQVRKILDIARGGASGKSLLPTENQVNFSGRYDRSYFTPKVPSVTRVMPDLPLCVLSVGCDAGLIERDLLDAGHSVDAVPLDYIIAESARIRGVEILDVCLRAPARDVADQSYDLVLMNFCLPYVREPVVFLKRFTDKLAPGGRVAIVYWNWQSVQEVRKRWIERRSATNAHHVGDFTRSGIHRTEAAKVHGWLKGAGLAVARTEHDVPGKYARASALSLKLIDPLVSVTATVLSAPVGKSY